MSATVLNEAKIETTPAGSLDELLREVPGLILPAAPSSMLGPTSNVVAMRGVGPRSALVLLDGIPLNEAFSAAVLWTKVPLFGVGRVEVVRGAATSLWGNLAVGGVVNVLTRPIRQDEARFAGTLGSDDTRHASLGLAGRRGAWGASLLLDSFDTAGWLRTLPGEAGRADIPASSNTATAQFKTEVAPSERSGVWLRAAYFDDDRSAGTRSTSTRQGFLDLAASGHRALSGGGELLASAYRNTGDREIDNASFAPGVGRDVEFRNARVFDDQKESGGSAQASWSLGRRLTQATVGIDVRSVEADETSFNFDITGQQVSSTGFGGRQDSAGLFAQASVAPTARLEILASARLDRWQNQDGFELLASGVTVRHPDRDTQQFDPRLALRYELSADLGLRGAVYRAFRAPVLQELYRPFRRARAAQDPNPALGPETILGAEAGLDWLHRRLRSELTVFTNEVDDQIGPAIIATTPILLSKPVNLGRTRTRGFEWLGRYTTGSRWEFEGAYTYNDSEILENLADPVFVGNEVPLVPRRAAQLGATYRHPRGVTVVARGRHVARRFEDVANTLALDAHTVFDLSLGWSATEWLTLLLRGENLGDELYVAELRQDRRRGAPRQVFFTARVTLDRDAP